jgi:signal transduction histidine kinase
VPTRSVYPRLFLPFAGLLLLALLVAWWLATSLIARTLDRRLDAQLELALDVLAEERVPLTPELLGRVSHLIRADIALIDPNGRVTLSTSEYTSRVVLRAAVAGGTPGARRDVVTDFDGTPLRIVTRPLMVGHDARYAGVAAIASLTDVRMATREAAAWLGGAGLALLALLGGIGHRLASGITVPLGQLSDFAERIAAGERSDRVTLSAATEIEALARAFNSMAERLETYERELVQRHRLAALGELAARVAHEIRNPLTAIKLQIELLAERADGEARAKLGALLDEVRRLELVVSTTLAAGQPAKLALRDADLSRIAADVTGLMQPQLAHRGIALETDLATLPSVPLDGARIKQVLLNLIANAGDAMPSGGRLRIATRGADGALELVVEDSGPGMPEAERARLARGEPASGPGIGLDLSRELVALHGGALAADTSPALGGARLTVRLPLRAAADTQ